MGWRPHPKVKSIVAPVADQDLRMPDPPDPTPTVPAEDVAKAIAKLLADESRPGPGHFPTWTGQVVLAWFPVSVLATAVAGWVAGGRLALPTLAALLLGFFLVVGIWITPGRSVRSLIGIVAAAIVLTAASTCLLWGVAQLGAGLDAAGGGGSDRPAAAEPEQRELDERDLGKADLAGRQLSGRDLSRRVLDGARLDGTQAVRTQFVSAWLRDVSFRGSRLVGADFTDACLTGADLRGAELSGAVFTGADVRGALVDEDKVRQVESWPSTADPVASTACASTSRPSR
jgi:hypothetical protein